MGIKRSVDIQASLTLYSTSPEQLTRVSVVQAYATDETPISPEEEKALLWKQDKRIVPLSAAIYFLCYLDRSNIGNAKILNASTHHGKHHTSSTGAHPS